MSTRLLKGWLLAVLCVVSLYGCAYLKAQGAQAVADYKTCKADPVCYSQAQNDGDLLGSASSIAGAVFIPAPIANGVGKGVAVISTAIFAFWFGRKKRKASEQPKV